MWEGKRSNIPAMLREICWQSPIRGEPAETWFTNVESLHLEARATSLLAAGSLVGAAWVAARMAAATGRIWNLMFASGEDGLY